MTIIEQFKLVIEQQLEKVVGCYLKVKWFIQRGRRGWADCDAWDLSTYLTGWLPNALRCISADCLPPLNKKITLMAEGFEAKDRMKKHVYGPAVRTEAARRQDYKKNHKKFQRGLALFVEWFDML